MLEAKAIRKEFGMKRLLKSRLAACVLLISFAVIGFAIAADMIVDATGDVEVGTDLLVWDDLSVMNGACIASGLIVTGDVRLRGY